VHVQQRVNQQWHALLEQLLFLSSHLREKSHNFDLSKVGVVLFKELTHRCIIAKNCMQVHSLVHAASSFAMQKKPQDIIDLHMMSELGMALFIEVSHCHCHSWYLYKILLTLPRL